MKFKISNWIYIIFIEETNLNSEIFSTRLKRKSRAKPKCANIFIKVIGVTCIKCGCWDNGRELDNTMCTIREAACSRVVGACHRPWQPADCCPCTRTVLLARFTPARCHMSAYHYYQYHAYMPWMVKCSQ